MAMEIFSIMPVDRIVTVLVRSITVFLFAFFVLRLLGKKHLAHLTYLDLLVVIALGSAVGDVMIYEESTTQFFAAVLAIGIVGICVKLIMEIASRSRAFNSFVVGTPTLLVSDGEIMTKAFAKEDINQEEIKSILREKGIQSIKDVHKMYMELDGDFSIILKRHKRNNH